MLCEICKVNEGEAYGTSWKELVREESTVIGIRRYYRVASGSAILCDECIERWKSEKRANLLSFTVFVMVLSIGATAIELYRSIKKSVLFDWGSAFRDFLEAEGSILGSIGCFGGLATIVLFYFFFEYSRETKGQIAGRMVKHVHHRGGCPDL